MRALFLGAVVVALAGCATDPRVHLKALEDENRALTLSVKAADQAAEASAQYIAALQSPAKAGSDFSLYFTPASLEQMATRMVPYKMPGRDFNSKLQGTLIVERVSDFRFLPGNKVRCVFQMRGEGVRYTGSVPSFAKGQVKEFEQLVTRGAVVDMEVQLSLEGNYVRAKAQALEVRLKAKRDASAESRLRDEMNSRALRVATVFDMTIQGAAAPRRLMVTGNHIIVTYPQ